MLKRLSFLSLSLIVVLCVCSTEADILNNEYKDVKNEVLNNSSENLNNIENATNEFSRAATVYESRGWKKTALPFLLGITLKMTTLLPMISSLMTIIGGVALIASKLALILSIGIAVHYYLVTKQQMQHFRQPLGHSAIYDPVVPVSPYPITHRLSVQAS